MAQLKEDTEKELSRYADEIRAKAEELIQQAKTQTHDAEARVSQATRRATELNTDSAKEAAQTVQEAREQAARLISEAQAEAQAIRRSAEEDANAAKQSADDHIAALSEQKNALTGYLEDVRRLLDNTGESIALQTIVENGQAHAEGTQEMQGTKDGQE